ncbi:hypothetical protein [Mesorhizobium sp.]|uniref:hypothetical protein n=1 Tax=Mesorhizobium sp. TaxID=1871066 RepID=UPI000FE3BB6C|nr:hypothetical protein [Mesorhizobium sp.]RWJ03445.1 MAG: hypothetical protein EOR24_32200 [Mesorhizobium sp.]
MNKNQLLANILMAPADDMPAIIAAAINEWTADGRSITDLLTQVSVELGTIDDAELRDEFVMALEDWT